ncbi:hypothetical protein CBR_g29808 [Chara braunii]|uniref:Cystatin domain-containing protein n=1 Tax=Chara braunii TaxID=69332 RepID=A0A388LBG5_CHABU|nr:hypothetical protein CBR_g29808 [Chara braunii]|eukprot:GBG79660.1 hypothetical protein CBR_g29808 [Chara braunii]
MGWSRQPAEFTICSSKSRKLRKWRGVAVSFSSSFTSARFSFSPASSCRSTTRSLLEPRTSGSIARAIYTCSFVVILALFCTSRTYAWPSSRGDDADVPVGLIAEPASNSGRAVEGGLAFQGEVALAEEGEEPVPRGPTVSTYEDPLIASPAMEPTPIREPILTVDRHPLRIVGGLTPQNANDLSMQEIAQFAVNEHNKQRAENHQTEVTLIGILSAASQVVAGIMYHLTLEIGTENGHEKFLAKVVDQAWMNSRELVSFEKLPDVHGESHLRTTRADLGAHRGTRPRGRHSISTEDPAVKQAVEHAERGIRARSNSLEPPEVKEVVSAEAEVGDGTTIHLVLNVGISSSDHIVKASMHRTDDGHWRMKSMEIKKHSEHHHSEHHHSEHHHSEHHHREHHAGH